MCVFLYILNTLYTQYADIYIYYVKKTLTLDAINHLKALIYIYIRDGHFKQK